MCVCVGENVCVCIWGCARGILHWVHPLNHLRQWINKAFASLTHSHLRSPFHLIQQWFREQARERKGEGDFIHAFFMHFFCLYQLNGSLLTVRENLPLSPMALRVRDFAWLNVVTHYTHSHVLLLQKRLLVTFTTDIYIFLATCTSLFVFDLYLFYFHAIFEKEIEMSSVFLLFRVFFFLRCPPCSL